MSLLGITEIPEAFVYQPDRPFPIWTLRPGVRFAVTLHSNGRIYRCRVVSMEDVPDNPFVATIKLSHFELALNPVG